VKHAHERLNEGTTYFTVGFDSLDLTILRVEKSYDVIDFLVEVGSILGLFVGISTMTILEIVEVFLIFMLPLLSVLSSDTCRTCMRMLFKPAEFMGLQEVPEDKSKTTEETSELESVYVEDTGADCALHEAPPRPFVISSRTVSTGRGLTAVGRRNFTPGY
jgi:hypothetical protein